MNRAGKSIKILFFFFLGILVVSGIFLILGLVQPGPPPQSPPGPGIPPAPTPAPTTPGYVWISALGALIGGIGSLISGTVALIVVLRKSRA